MFANVMLLEAGTIKLCGMGPNTHGEIGDGIKNKRSASLFYDFLFHFMGLLWGKT